MDIPDLLEYRIALGESESVVLELLAELDSLEERNLDLDQWDGADQLGNIGKASKHYETIVNRLAQHFENSKNYFDFDTAFALKKLDYRSEHLDEVLNEWDEIHKTSYESEQETINSYFRSAYNLPNMLVADFDAAIKEFVNLVSWDVYGSAETAIAVLCKLDEFAEPIKQRLWAELSIWGDQSKVGIFRALHALGGGSEETIAQEVIKLLHSESSTVCYKAVNLLKELGDFSEAIESVLLSTLDAKYEQETVQSLSLSRLDRDASARRNFAIRKLVEMGNHSDQLIQVLIDNLSKEQCDTQVLPSLAILGKADRTVEAKVVEWIEQNSNYDNVWRGIDVLWEIVE